MPTQKYLLGGKRHGAQDAAFLAALDDDLWSEGDGQNWHSYWHTGMPKPSAFENLSDHQNINHIPGNAALTIKSRLHETLAAARDRQTDSVMRERYDFFPHVFDMPRDYHAFQAHAAANPEQNWILKPKNSSRGRGIEVVTDVSNVPSSSRWMVQRYLDNPDLIDGRKYVLRLYVLVTSVVPLQIYLYREGMTKLASEAFDLDSLDNPFAQLTNPDINIHNEAADVPVVFYSLKRYREILRDRGDDPGPLFEKVRDLVKLTVMAARESFRSRLEKGGVNGHACYELLGLDCMVDSDLKPWLLECNLSPSLDYCMTHDDADPHEAETKTAVVRDLVNLRGHNAPSARPKPSDYDAREDFIEATLTFEDERRGGFERLFPAPKSVQADIAGLSAPLLDDIIAANIVDPDFTTPDLYGLDLAPHVIGEDNRVHIYHRRAREFVNLSVEESWVWLNLSMGRSSVQIAEDMSAQLISSGAEISPAQRWTVSAFTWDCLSRWVERGHCRLSSDPDIRADGENQEKAATASPGSSEKAHLIVILNGHTVSIETFDHSLIPVLSDRFRANLAANDASDVVEHQLLIAQSAGGYCLIRDGHVGPVVRKIQLLSSIDRALLAMSCTDDFPIALNTDVEIEQGVARVVINPKDTRQTRFGRGLLLDPDKGHFRLVGLGGPTDSTLADIDITKLDICALDEDGGLRPELDLGKRLQWITSAAITRNGILTDANIDGLIRCLGEA